MIDREKKEIYFGETQKYLSQRYPLNQIHHTFKEWNEYCVINLPPETTNQTRLLIERVLIAIGAKFFKSSIYNNSSFIENLSSFKLLNKKK